VGLHRSCWKVFAGGPGCVCTLYGKANAYQIAIHCLPPEAPPIVVLKIQGLDDPQASSRLPVFGGRADAFATWQVLVSRMLEAEGFVGMSLPELEAWNREHGY
jgi:hypothetical protein